MALTIAIEGKGVIANADAISDTAGGTWSEQGGGTISVSNDVFLIGTAAIGGKYASKSGFHQYDIGAGNELDFTATTGTEEGQMLYIWVSMTALGTLDTLANFGLCIRLSSSSPGTTNYIDYLIAGHDDKNNWSGGFRCFVIDPTLTPSRVSGTQSTIIASVRTVGVWIDCSTSARADSIFTDQIAVGKGLRITGTSTTGWSDIVTYCNDFSLRGWGMFQEREGIAYAYGTTFIGDAVNQAANVSFTDSARTIQYGFTEYYESAAWKTTMGIDVSGLVIEDHTSFTTTFSDGVAVGADNGRSGTSFIGTPSLDVSFDLYGGNNVGSVTTLYNTQLKGLTGGVTWGNDADHKFFGGTIAGCDQFDPVGAVQLRNLVISGYAGTLGALLWNENIDIQSTQFIANTDITNNPSGIEMSSAVGTPYTYNSLTFSGNDFDVNNTSGSAISVAKTNGADPSTYTGSLVTFTANFNHVLTGMAENTEVTYVLQSNGTVVFHVENVSATKTTTYTHGGGELVDILIFHIDYTPELSNILNLTLPNSDSSAGITQFSDDFYLNP